jgi:hypothetical protein
MRRNPVVGRMAGLDWSERGRRMLREGLLEVYRRWGAGTFAPGDVTGERQRLGGGGMRRAEPW